MSTPLSLKHQTIVVEGAAPAELEYPQPRPPLVRWSTPTGAGWIKVLAALGVVLVFFASQGLGITAQVTLTVFAAAVWLWIFSSFNDTFVALGAAVTLVLANVITAEEFFAPLGHDTTWLLIGAFIVAAAITESGVALRATAMLTQLVSTPRALVHVLAFATTLTAFAVPATSGRAALIVPVLAAVAGVLGGGKQWLTKVLSLVLPTVILFTAAASLIGAGAHLITLQILDTNGLPTIGVSQWVLYGFPYAAVMSVASAELILLMFSTRSQRAEKVSISKEDFGPLAAGRLGRHQRTALYILGATVILWFTEAIHGIDPAIVAIVSALVITSPGVGTLELKDAVKKVPWNLLLFMAATIAVSQALTASGASEAIASRLLGTNTPALYVVAVIVVSSLAHLVIQSRSARSAVLIPLVVATAIPLGINPVAAAFASTVAAGFCHTLPSSAKPLAIFSDVGGVTTFTNPELFKTAAALLPVHLVAMAVFTWIVWPALGLNLYL